MLKYIKHILGFLLVLAILITGAGASPAHAASANIILIQIQAGGVGTALQERVSLYNNSPEDVDISDWCVKNKSNVSFACFVPPNATQTIYLPAYSFTTISSTAMAVFMPTIQFGLTYTSVNQSSGAIIGSSDTISLVNKAGDIVDQHTWSTSITGGMMFNRKLATPSPHVYLDTDQTSDWLIQNPVFFPDDDTELHERVVEPEIDVCPNLEGLQVELPENFEIGGNGDCREHLYSLRLSEILPNAVGSDTGHEFIEIYNPNEQTIDLTRYKLWVGPTLDKSFDFPVGSSIAPKAYLSFTNSDIAFSLLNTTSAVRLTGDGESLDETPPYNDPDDDQAWALIDGSWQYTYHPTPGAENTTVIETAEVSTDPEVETNKSNESTTTLKPCADNQYRSPETNRCRLIATTQSTQTPCKDNQYRSEETNRCRNIASTDDGPAPCKEGQERNPDTNRCRTAISTPSADYGVLGTETKSSGNNWYLWLAIGGVSLIALGYGIWEWRHEIGKLFHKLTLFVRIRK